MIVTQSMESVRQAAYELMVESLKEQDVDRQIDNLLLQDADVSTLAKVLPVRTMADGFYPCAVYFLKLRQMLDSGIAFSILADDAEGLCAVEAARQDFERDHPACPQCGKRQYSSTPIRCRSIRCGMEFGKKR
jgi:NADH pyrophosphatase NudC (nudix superfamily)